MNIIDVQNEITFAELVTPAARTATVTGTGVDIRDYKGKLKATQHVGVVSGTTPTLDGKIQDSTDNSVFADLAGATFTQVTVTNNIQSIAVDTRVARRYIRYVGTIGGTTPNFSSSASFVGQKTYL